MLFRTVFRKASALTISTLLLVTISWADIRHVGNGGGASEQMLLYAFDQLPRLLETCKASFSCAQNSDERNLLDALIRNHQSEIASGGLKFPMPWTHSRDLLYVTEPRIGSAIEVNVERLYDPMSGYRVPAPLPDAIEIVTGALMEHHGFNEDATRDLAKRAGTIWTSQIRDINLSSITHPEISLMTVRSEAEPLGSSILIGFGQGFTNISSVISAELPCPSGQKVTTLSFTNLYWSPPEADSARRHILLRANGSLRFTCGNEVATELTQSLGTAILEFKTSVKNGSADAFLKDPARLDLVPATHAPKVMLFDLH